MKSIRACYLLVITTVLIFVSCEQDKPDKEPEKKENYNVILNINQYGVDTCQVIFSDHRGYIILDTIVSSRQEHELSYQSETAKVNMSIIYKTTDFKVATTFIDIIPANWIVTPNGDFYGSNQNTDLLNYPGMSQSKIIYKNLPSGFYHDFVFSASLGEPYQATNHYDSLEIDYTHRTSSHYVYLFLPEVGLYDITKVTHDTTIYLTQMNEATRLNLPVNLDYPVTPTDARIFCYPEIDDPYCYFLATDYFTINPSDQFYPSEGIAIYSCSFSWNDELGNMYSNYSYNSNVPDTNVLIDRAEVELSHSSIDNIQVTFPLGLPAFYTVTWVDEGLVWYNILPPDVNNYNPKDIWQTISTSYLKDIDPSFLKLQTLMIEKSENLTYQSFFDKIFDTQSTENVLIKESKKFYLEHFE